MRKHWMDNLRWVTVLSVLFFHVFYFYNNKGVFGGIGGLGDGPQYQDVVMYILYPWFMPLMFLLAGISSKYALNRRSDKEWIKARTHKLLVPATIGLFVFQWIPGYFNTLAVGLAQNTDLTAGMSLPGKYLFWSLRGIGHLWFIQDLWLISLFLLLLRKLDPSDKLHAWCGKFLERKSAIVWIILLGVLFWMGEHTQIMDPIPDSIEDLWNYYKPLFYLIIYLMGYYVFSHDNVHNLLGKAWKPLMGCAVIAGVILVVTTFGEDNTTSRYLASPLNCIYGWLMCLAMIGWFRTCFDRTSAFAGYMTRSSFGIYVVHYLFIASLGYSMKVYMQLPHVLMYVILSVAVFALSPLLVEIIKRIPVIRWCVLGIRSFR